MVGLVDRLKVVPEVSTSILTPHPQGFLVTALRILVTVDSLWITFGLAGLIVDNLWITRGRGGLGMLEIVMVSHGIQKKPKLKEKAIP